MNGIGCELNCARVSVSFPTWKMFDCLGVYKPNILKHRMSYNFIVLYSLSFAQGLYNFFILMNESVDGGGGIRKLYSAFPPLVSRKNKERLGGS